MNIQDGGSEVGDGFHLGQNQVLFDPGSGFWVAPGQGNVPWRGLGGMMGWPGGGIWNAPGPELGDLWCRWWERSPIGSGMTMVKSGMTGGRGLEGGD